jgi:hypothetical protein
MQDLSKALEESEAAQEGEADSEATQGPEGEHPFLVETPGISAQEGQDTEAVARMEMEEGPVPQAPGQTSHTPPPASMQSQIPSSSTVVPGKKKYLKGIAKRGPEVSIYIVSQALVFEPLQHNF